MSSNTTILHDRRSREVVIHCRQQFSHAEMNMQDERGSLLTKDSLHIHFYRADARHEISCRRKYILQPICKKTATYEWAGLNCCGIYVEIIMQDERGSLLTKGSLYIHFYRADARHEISCRRSYILQPVCERRQLMNG